MDGIVGDLHLAPRDNNVEEVGPGFNKSAGTGGGDRQCGCGRHHLQSRRTADLAQSGKRRGVSSTLNGLMAAMPSIAVLTAGFFIPRIVQRVGAVRCIYLGTALSVLALLLFSGIDSVIAWFALRFVMAPRSALIWIVSETWVNGHGPGPPPRANRPASM